MLHRRTAVAVDHRTYSPGTLAFSEHLHDAVINRFNFEYVYHYLFEPEKVKGIAFRASP